jgi:hypothetical protein
VSRIGRGSPDRPQCADAAKRSRFDRVGILLATASCRLRPGGCKIVRIEQDGCDSHRDCAAVGKGRAGSGAPLGFWAP